MNDDELTPRERERMRRQDRSAGAKDRAPMRAGMGKVFKQILDAQARAAREMRHEGKGAAEDAPARDEAAGDAPDSRKSRPVRRR